MEAESLLFLCRQRLPIMAGSLQHGVSTHDVGFDKGRRAVDRAVNVAFCRQVHHEIRLVVRKYAVQSGTVADINLLESIALVVRHARQRLQVTGIGELINHHHAIAGPLDDMSYHGRADKSGPAGDQNTFQRQTPLVSTIQDCLISSGLMALNSL
ncbi:hypothetical protein D3C73_289720 [compost metagenome]